MRYQYETVTVEVSRTYASEHIGGVEIISQPGVDTVVKTMEERRQWDFKIVAAGQDAALLVFRRGETD
jgi:hypothetical protein